MQQYGARGALNPSQRVRRSVSRIEDAMMAHRTRFCQLHDGFDGGWGMVAEATAQGDDDMDYPPVHTILYRCDSFGLLLHADPIMVLRR